MTNPDSWQEKLHDYLPELIEIRRHLHSHPELSGHEHETAALVAGELRKYGWRVDEGVGRTGIVAELGPVKGPFVGLRVDMDALPIEERTGLPYSSKRQGVMHACGHDLHVAVGLGVAKILADENKLPMGVRLLFQPAEEIAQGASWMREDGAIQRLEALFGLHVFPELKVGTIGVRNGSLTAAAGEIQIEILGEGGHGARPHQAIDAIWVAARVVSGLQESISRCLDPLSPVVVSFGRIEGGKAFNVIADRVKLLGTVRCLDSSLHKSLPIWIEDTVKSICSSLGAKASVRYRCIAPPVYNDPELTSIVSRCAVELLGPDCVIYLEQPSLGAEDFAEFLQEVRGTMFRLGVAGTEGCSPLHNGTFSLHEDSLEVGIKVLVSTLLKFMDNHCK